MAKPILTNTRIQNEYAIFIGLGVLVLLLISAMEWLKWASDGGLWLSFKILAPVIVMVAYLLRYKELRVGKEFEAEFADSFYYMGFGFTLFALLLSFFAILNDEQLNTIKLLGNLGVALATTIFGLIVRVFYTSFEPTSDATLNQVNAELQQSSSRLSKAAADHAASIESSTKKVLEFGADITKISSPLASFRNSVSVAEGDTKDFSEALTEVAVSSAVLSKGAKISGEALSENTLKIKEMESSLSSITKTIAASDSNLGEQLKIRKDEIIELQLRYGEMNVVLQQANIAASAELETFNQAMSAFSALVIGDTADYSALSGSLQNITSKSAAAATALTSFEASLSNSNAAALSITKIVSSLTEVASKLETVENIDFESEHQSSITKLTEASSRLEETMKKVAALAADIEVYIGTSSELINSVEGHLVENLRALNERIT